MKHKYGRTYGAFRLTSFERGMRLVREVRRSKNPDADNLTHQVYDALSAQQRIHPVSHGQRGSTLRSIERNRGIGSRPFGVTAAQWRASHQ